MKLGLGAVQIGLNYGISNKNGKTSEEEVAEILAVAACQNIRIIDTAPLYGTSEEVLGRKLPKIHDFHVVTKTISIGSTAITSSHVKLLEETFFRSIKKLQASSVYALLVHHANDLLAYSGELIMEKMLELKHQGFIEKVGASVYTSIQIEKILRRYPIDIMQLPVNVMDQRLIQGGYLKELKAAGVEIHARSVFLQGVLLMDPDSLPAHFNTVKPHLKHYRNSIRERGFSPVRAALGFVIGLPEIDFVICGVNDHKQLQELCAIHAIYDADEFRSFAIEDETILNPTLWQCHP